MSRRCEWIIVGRDRSIAAPGRPIVDLDRQIAVVAERAAVAGVMIFESHRPTIPVRRTASRTAVKTGRLIGNRIVERIAVRMPEERCGGWIVPIRWQASMGGTVGTMRGPLRWIGPIAASERNVRNGLSAPSGRRDRNDRSGLRELDGISRALKIRGGQAAAPGDLPGAAMVLRWPCGAIRERMPE